MTSSAIGSFAIGISPIGGPPPELPPLTVQIPSYLYQEYSDDDNLQALVLAQNDMAQAFLDRQLGLNLPIYTQQSGALLDWVAEGLYGMYRPTFASGTFQTYGPLNSLAADDHRFSLNNIVKPSSQQVYVVNDDLFKRCLTWNFFKGDGFQFTCSWLKRRVMRFLNGVNGVDPGINQTYAVSVGYSGSAITITIENPGQFNILTLQVLQSGIHTGVLQLPFQYSFTVVI